jgi:hypothetical protein
VLPPKDYEVPAQEQDYFGNFDPFGDFYLTFGAAKQNLKIVETPIYYKAAKPNLAVPRWLAAPEDGVVRLSEAESRLIAKARIAETKGPTRPPKPPAPLRPRAAASPTALPR